MKRAVCLVAALILLRVTTASATTIASDDFAYSDGSLFGRSGGFGWGPGSIWTGSGMDVASQQAVSNVPANPPKYGSRPFVNPAATNTLFIRFELTVGSYALDDYLGAQLYTGVNNNILLWAKLPGGNEIGVGNSGLVSTGITLAPSATTTLVAAYFITPGPATDQLMIWVSPDVSDYFDPLTGASSADATSFELVAFHAAAITLFAEQAGVAFDNLLISDDPAGVGLSVPEPATIASLALGLGALARGRARPRIRRPSLPRRVA